MSDRPSTPTALTELFRTQMPFCDVLGVEVVEGAAERVVVTGAWDETRCTAAGVLHGGYLMALADSAGAGCAVLNLPRGASTSTIESKTNFFRGVTGGPVTATAVPVHVGRRTIVVQTDVVRADGKLVTRTTQTQAVIS